MVERTEGPGRARPKLPPNPSSTLLVDQLDVPSVKHSKVGALRAEERHRSAKERRANLDVLLRDGKPWKRDDSVLNQRTKCPVCSISSREATNHWEDKVAGVWAWNEPHERGLVQQLAENLQGDTRQFNLAWGHKDPDAPVIEFLVAAAQGACQLYSSYFTQVADQVGLHCEERGLLLNAIWSGLTGVLQRTLLRVRDQSCILRSRLEALEGQQEVNENKLQEEIDSLKAQVKRLQTTGPSHRLSLRKSLGPSDLAAILGAVGGSSAARPERATMVRFQPSEAELAEARLTESADDAIRRSIEDRHSTGDEHPRQHHGLAPKADALSSTLGRSAAPDLRRGSVVDNLKMGNRRASVVASNLLKQLQAAEVDASGVDSSEEGTAPGRVEALRKQLEECRSELYDVYDQIAQLEAVADQAVLLESRIEAAESERDDALERARVYTPRPAPVFHSADPPLNDAAAAMLAEVMEVYRSWPASEIAGMVVGERAGSRSAVETAPFAFACLNSAVLEDELSRPALLEALQEGVVKPLAGLLTQQQLAWIEKHLEGHAAECQELATFLCGISRAGFEYSEEHYGCLAVLQPGLTAEKVAEAVTAAQLPTAQRVQHLEEENRQMREELQAFRSAAAMQAEMEARAAANRQLREEEAKFEKPNPLDVYLELLAASDEASVRDGLMGMGTAPDVPKLFRCNGKVRNKQMSKRETEKMVKEIWKEKLADMRSGKQTDLAEFVFQTLQTRVGIVATVIEMGYNLLYSVWKYSYDADCSLFLKTLKGDIKEDVYLQQITLQADLDLLFLTLDRTVHTVETGTVPKADIATALEVFLRVGDPGGKTRERFDALMQALDADQEGPVVSYKKLFEEDREYNQGEFAETVRDQFLAERMEYFRELQQLLYSEALNEESASKEQVVRALCRADPELSDKAAWSRANEVFAPGVDKHSIKLLMKRLQAGVVKRQRDSSTKLSVASRLGKGKSLANSAQRQKAKISSSIQEAVEAVRQKLAGVKYKPQLQGARTMPPETLVSVVQQEVSHGKRSLLYHQTTC